MGFCKIINDDILNAVSEIDAGSVDVILTSPPYNMTKRRGGYADKTKRYDQYNDWLPEDKYLEWSVQVFNAFDTILNERGVVLYNFSYSIENPSLPYKLVYDIVQKTNFQMVDTVIWKKKTAIPFPANKYRLGRIWEFVFVLVKKGKENDFNINRKVKSVSAKTNQPYYEVIQNFFEARNNDGANPYNKATFSTEMALKLLDIYAQPESIVLDPFMGTGTTGVACMMRNLNFIGVEISKDQTEYAQHRIEEYAKESR